MPGLGVGLDGQIGIAQEGAGAFGTFVPPTRFIQFIGGETLKAARTNFVSESIGGLIARTSSVRSYQSGAAGDIPLEVMTKGMGLWLKQLMGYGVSAQVGVTPEYTQTFHPDLVSGGNGLSASLQVGRPTTDGVVRAFSYAGAKVVSFEFTANLDEALKLTTTWDAVSEDTSKTLGVATLATGAQPFIFIDAALTIDGTAQCVKGLSIKGDRALDTDRRCLGPVQTKKEQLANGKFAITGQLDMEFDSMTQYNKFMAGTPANLVANFSFGQIPGTANPYSCVFTLPSIIYSGDTPNLADEGVLQLSLPFDAYYNGTLPALEIVIHTDDTAL